jgi:hypothetical protein
MSTVGLVNLGKLHKNAPQKFSTFGVLYVLYLFYLTAMVEFIETFGMCFFVRFVPAISLKAARASSVLASPIHLPRPGRLQCGIDWLEQTTPVNACGH